MKQAASQKPAQKETIYLLSSAIYSEPLALNLKVQTCGKKKRQQIIRLTKPALTLINALSAKVLWNSLFIYYKALISVNVIQEIIWL